MLIKAYHNENTGPIAGVENLVFKEGLLGARFQSVVYCTWRQEKP